MKLAIAALVRGVVDDARLRVVVVDRRRVDDRRARPQVRQRRLGDPEQRVDVGLEGGVELLGRDAEKRLLRLLVAGVVDEDVEAAEPGDRVGDQLLAERFVADVARQGHRLAAGRLDQLHDLARVWFLGGQVADRDVGAFARIGDRRGPADAGVAAGDERLAPARRPEPT